MLNRNFRLRFRRSIKRQKKQVVGIGEQAEYTIEKHFFKRLGRFSEVRRFVFVWVMLLALLIGGVVMQTRALDKYYLVSKPVAGGIYSEGMLGTFTNANPIFASGAVDSSVSRLLFNGLLRYDNNNALVGDLAETWNVDERGKVYTVILKENLLWHDGKPLTAEDVMFTYQTIQNPDVKSTLFSSWTGVTLEQVDARTVRFTLPNTLSSFPYSLVNGIVPKHILKDVPAAQLRSNDFNTDNPVGSGPFVWSSITINGTSSENREEQISLSAFENYHLGRPKLDQIVLRVFSDEKRLENAFRSQQLTAVNGMNLAETETFDTSGLEEHNIPFTGSVMVFFNNSIEPLNDEKVRRALVMSADPQAIRLNLGYPTIAVDSPLLKGQLGYDKAITQLGTNLEEANRLLDESGWVKQEGGDGIRKKDGKSLGFEIVAQNLGEYARITQLLQDQWRGVGVELRVSLLPDEELQQGYLLNHAYDALLYGISIGVDPDVFAYWHSSQADPRSKTRLNFSEYNSKVADTALEAGRTRTDESLRAVKYKPFLEVWRNDAPALGLYQPRFWYFTRGKVVNFDPKSFNVAADRFNSVHQWMIRFEKTSQ